MNLTLKRMLQCLTVVAGVFAFTATAEQTWWGVKDAFENADGGTNGMLIAEYKATGIESSGVWSTNYLWLAAETDASKIVTNDTARADYDGIEPITDPAANELVLELATEGNTLTRHVIDDSSTGRTFSAASPVYVDTLIKFTPSEDTPTISNDVKIAVYVNVNSNLVVYHGTETGSVHSVFDKKISPNAWKRLTIKLNADGATYWCSIYLDSDELTHPNANGDEHNLFLTAASGNVLNAVAFQGTGYVDELVVSDAADLGDHVGIVLTLSWDTGILSVTTNNVAVENNGTVPNGAAIAITAKDWYKVAAVTGAAFSPELTEPAKSASGTVTAATNTNVAITSAVNTGITAMGSNTVNGAKLAAWAITNNKSESDVQANATDWYDEYLLNIAPSEEPATIAITSITLGVDTATIDVVAAASTAVDFASINGTLNIYAAEDLVTGFGTTPVATSLLTFTPANNTNTVVVPLTSGNFIKAKIE